MTDISLGIFQQLCDRRDAAAFGLLCKLLDGVCADGAVPHVPVVHSQASNTTTRQTSRHHSIRNYRLEISTNSHRRFSLESYNRSFMGQISNIFDSLPDCIKIEGLKNGWHSIMKEGQKFLCTSRCV